ncbi:hypothetical protein Desor_1949 [Desulfosporosinus orientis DSM 765]|uniref:Uncharacterized protein n=1 Tax=Desulfosporosinus orientis (strain ATCC 19365 / DSM 765 / NCIMB 8382 / VKM B-1628 / Singapore I) TaxID=768706 RepID=G7WD82_DESOD|nr:hypothetical protein Desor_1949 [Desulfosporosinus orientis DSM 765]
MYVGQLKAYDKGYFLFIIRSGHWMDTIDGFEA